MPVVPATQEAEARESLEIWRSGLHRAVMVPVHSRLDNTVRPVSKTKQQNSRSKALKPGEKLILKKKQHTEWEKIFATIYLKRA